MTDNSKSTPPSSGQFLLYQTTNGKLKIDVCFESETLRLTQSQMFTELGFASAQRPTTTRGANRAWSEWFDELVQYQAQHGDCNVPTRWPDNRGLGVWVSNQRQLKKQGRLEPERERMLSEIGFNW